MTLSSGTFLGPYQIITPLGAGGMGEVYRARDTKLNREVALKVLPDAFAADVERMARFEREARVLAALNHPNIAAVYGLEESAGTRALVMELVEGWTLADSIAQGPIPVDEALPIAKQVAEALEYAHEKGIIHRDLKSANVKVTPEGTVKVLDFGLAKALEESPAAANIADSPTLSLAATKAGVILGTAAYMPPEQAKGKSVDRRADIWAFGCVLYEMLTGKRIFDGETTSDVLAAVIMKEPDWNALSADTPAGIQKLLRRCLAKDPKQRLQAIGDARIAIEETLNGEDSGALVSSPAKSAMGISRPQPRWRRALPWVAAALGVLALGAAIWVVGLRSAAKPQPKFTRLTYQQGYLSNARFAKDGGMVMYSAQWNNDPMQIYSVRLEFPQSVKVDLPSAALLALSPSGDLELAVDPVYVGGTSLSGTLAQAQMAGGTPRALEKNVRAADFAPDGKTLAVVRGANRKAQLEYPAGKAIYTNSGYLDYVRISPSGKEVAFLEHPVLNDDRGWVSVVDEGGNHKQLTKEYASAQGLAWSRTGTEIWFTAAEHGTDLQLYGVSLSGKQREILTMPQRTRLMDIAADGRVLLSQEQHHSEITAIDPATGKERRGLEWFDESILMDILPDGKAILFNQQGGPAGPLTLVVYRKLDGSAPVALGPGQWPKFSPDGTMAAALIVTKPPQVALHPIGTGESRRLPVGDIVSLDRLDWFPDGKHLLLMGATAGQPVRTYELDLAGGKPQPIGPPDFWGIAVAEDGKRIAGWQASAGWVVFDRETQKAQVMPRIEGSLGPRIEWTADGQALLMYSATRWEARMYRVEMATGKRTLLQTVKLSEQAGLVMQMQMVYAENSKTTVYNAVRILGTLYMVEGLQ